MFDIIALDAASPMGPHRGDGRVSVALLSCLIKTSSFKKRHFECFYFKFCFVHSGITSSTKAICQADKLSNLEGKTELANG